MRGAQEEVPAESGRVSRKYVFFGPHVGQLPPLRTRTRTNTNTRTRTKTKTKTQSLSLSVLSSSFHVPSALINACRFLSALNSFLDAVFHPSVLRSAL